MHFSDSGNIMMHWLQWQPYFPPFWPQTPESGEWSLFTKCKDLGTRFWLPSSFNRRTYSIHRSLTHWYLLTVSSLYSSQQQPQDSKLMDQSPNRNPTNHLAIRLASSTSLRLSNVDSTLDIIQRFCISSSSSTWSQLALQTAQFNWQSDHERMYSWIN